MSLDPKIVAVVAMARNRVIGRDGVMPWTLSTDLRRYRRLTLGKPMIMGRKTLVSIGRVLDGRDSVVMTRGTDLPFEGAHLASSPDAALEIAAGLAALRGAEEIVIAGGAEVYALFADLIDRLYVTHVEAEPEGDARFFAIGEDEWTKVSEEAFPAGDKDSAASRFAVYDRR